MNDKDELSPEDKERVHKSINNMFQGLKQESVAKAAFEQAEASAMAARGFYFLNEALKYKRLDGDWKPTRALKWWKRRKANAYADLCFTSAGLHMKAADAFFIAAGIAGAAPDVLKAVQ